MTNGGDAGFLGLASWGSAVLGATAGLSSSGTRALAGKIAKNPSLERVALTCSQYCTVWLQFFAEKRLHILRNCSSASG